MRPTGSFSGVCLLLAANMISALGGAFAAFALVMAASSQAIAADAATPAPANPVIQPFLEFMSGNFAYQGAWFGLGEVPPSDFDGNLAWSELWLEVGANLNARGEAGTLYGSLSLGGSQTLGTDSFDQTDQGTWLLERAFLGFRTEAPEGNWNIDISAGQQDFGAGTGMLLWQGAGNGFERGALNIVQRTAWSMAALGKVSNGKTTFQGFFLNPNETESNDTETELAGALWRYDHSPQTNVGAYYLSVLQSKQIYPLPDLPLFIENGRDGLQAVQAFARLDGNDFGVANAWLRGEFAYEWNDDLAGATGMQAWAGYGELGYRFASVPMAPAISYAFATFSGDDPGTSEYERFDPLFYGNGLDNWWFGANGSYAFLNANLNYHRFTLQLAPTHADFLKFQYVITNANELNSPIQFGQAARLDLEQGGLIVGAPESHLADEFYGEWTHLFSQSVAATLWGSVAIPGDGIEQTYPGYGDPWLGAGFIVSVKLQ
jgi:hypothetical protein